MPSEGLRHPSGGKMSSVRCFTLSSKQDRNWRRETPLAAAYRQDSRRLGIFPSQPLEYQLEECLYIIGGLMRH